MTQPAHSGFGELHSNQKECDRAKWDAAELYEVELDVTIFCNQTLTIYYSSIR